MSVLVSTAYLLILRSTGAQAGSHKRRFCCSAAWPVSTQWSTALYWMERRTKEIKQCCAFDARQIRLSPTVLPYKEGGNKLTSCKNSSYCIVLSNKSCTLWEPSFLRWPNPQGKGSSDTKSEFLCLLYNLCKRPMESQHLLGNTATIYHLKVLHSSTHKPNPTTRLLHHKDLCGLSLETQC